MCGKTRRDRVRTEKNCGLVGVASMEGKVEENKPRRFGHIQR